MKKGEAGLKTWDAKEQARLRELMERGDRELKNWKFTIKVVKTKKKKENLK